MLRQPCHRTCGASRGQARPAPFESPRSMRMLPVEALPANSCAGSPSRFAGGQRTAVSLRSVSGQARRGHRTPLALLWSLKLLGSVSRRKRCEVKCQRGRQKVSFPRIHQRHNAPNGQSCSVPHIKCVSALRLRDQSRTSNT